MEQSLCNLKCNITIAVPVKVMTRLDSIVDRKNSRNKIVNEAILHWLLQQYNIVL